MYNFKSLRCFHCDTVLANLPEAEVRKLDGLNFMCECCGHQNLLKDASFCRGNNNDSTLNIFNIESFVTL